ncbi:hypothetical protein [Mucilaginibacter terrae]|uniref:DUF4412 domain-containing protein n=1 Tax=Mucilaginibacter terrae TaxID=1955052 RepID=A0ABU3GTR0_9SPHI|nr:hypothetical protein [Mucilaginibacter terrae]MDT3403152.1 hypothetical protein [Mucilaginibacter terrae]
MKSAFSYLSVLFVLLSFFASAQVKPAFKELTYVTYETDELKKHATIKDLLVIDANGQVKYKSVYYNGIADTIYKLTEAQVTKLNSIFNGQKPLKEYVIKTKMPGTMRFAGPFDYIIYESKDGKKDELTIVAPFMADEFNKALDYLAKGPAKADKRVKKIKNEILENQILKCEKATANLPKVELPPSEIITN